METRDWITLGSATLLIVGWFVNGYLNRRNEIAKKRLEYRLPTLKSFLKIWNMVQDRNKTFEAVEYVMLIEEVREGFHLYGQKDEVLLFEEFAKASVGKESDRERSIKAIEALNKLVRKRIRKELHIS